MRLLFLNHNVIRRGGTYYRAFDIARHLVRRGHSVTLLTISSNRRIGLQRDESEGVELIQTPDLFWGRGRSGWDPWDVLNRMAFLHGQEWDLIHAWDSRPVVILPALFARDQSKKTVCKFVLDWCDWWGAGGTQAERSGRLLKLINPVETFFEEHFRPQADGATVISKALRSRAESLGVRSASIQLLPQGCDTEKIQPREKLPARQKLGLPPGFSLVGHLGTLNPSDAVLLWDALRVLLREKPDCMAVVIGNHRQQIPDDLRQTGRLIETGFVSEETLHDFIAACDVFLAPLGDTIASRARWPSKVNLFLAAGKAVVMTRVGDLAEILWREKAGSVADCNAGDISQKTQQLLDDSFLRGQTEKNARQLAEGQLSWTGIVDRLEAFYLALRRAPSAEA